VLLLLLLLLLLGMCVLLSIPLRVTWLPSCRPPAAAADPPGATGGMLPGMPLTAAATGLL
jgi:hypothetical protein